MNCHPNTCEGGSEAASMMLTRLLQLLRLSQTSEVELDEVRELAASRKGEGGSTVTSDTAGAMQP